MLSIRNLSTNAISPNSNRSSPNTISKPVPAEFFKIAPKRKVIEVAEKPKGSFPGAIFESQGSSKPHKTQWIVKPGFIYAGLNDIELKQTLSLPAHSILNVKVRLNAISEKIAYDFYKILSRDKYIVPKARVAILPWINEYTKHDELLCRLIQEINIKRPENDKLDKGLHILSKKIEGYKDLNEATAIYSGTKLSFMEYINQTSRPPEEIMVDGEILPLVGFMEILAGAKLLHDIDVLGADASNVGFVVEDTPKGKIARAVKVDPGLAFNTSPDNMLLLTINTNHNGQSSSYMTTKRLKDPKDIQYSTAKKLISWSALSDKQKSDFVEALKHGISQLSDDIIMDFMIFRQGKFNEFARGLSLKSNYATDLIKLIQDNVELLKKEYSLNNVNLGMDFDDQIDNDSKYVTIKPGQFVILKHIKSVLDVWVNTMPPRFSIFNKDSKLGKIKAQEKIINCYKTQNPILDLEGLNLDLLPNDVFEYFEHVTEIRLNNNNLSILPDGIDKLSKLELLDIRGNKLFNDYKNLYNIIKASNTIKISLTSNQATAYLTTLLDLWINENNCSETERKSRKTAKDRIIKCYQNDLSSLDLSNLGLSSLPEVILRYLKITKLNLHNNKFPATFVLPSISLNTSLELNEEQKLNFLKADLNEWINESNCSEDEKAARIIAHDMVIKCYQQGGQALDLSGLGLSCLPERLFIYLKDLKELNIDNNKLHRLPSSIGKLSSLISLDVSANQLNLLPDSIGLLINLASLNLMQNNLTNLPAKLSSLKNLHELYLSNNQLTELPDDIGELFKLTHFSLRGNKLTKLPESIGKLENLVKLNAADNQLLELPITINGLKSLIDLDLYNNQLTVIPYTICALQSLKMLRLTKNKIQEIPHSTTLLWNNLESLNLRENSLHKLPEHLGCLEKLKLLNLYSNQISELPSSISKLKNLEQLELGQNPIQELPEGINFPKLKNNPFNNSDLI